MASRGTQFVASPLTCISMMLLGSVMAMGVQGQLHTTFANTVLRITLTSMRK